MSVMRYFLPAIAGLFLSVGSSAQSLGPSINAECPAGNTSSCSSVSNNSPTYRTHGSRGSDLSVNVKDGFTYTLSGVTTSVPGAKGDGVMITPRPTVTCTSASAAVTMTGSGVSLTQADVGKVISIAGCGSASGTLTTTIATVVDATHLTVADAASTSVSAAVKTVYYGTDDSAAITAISQAMFAVNGELLATYHPTKLYFPQGIYMVKSASVDFTEWHGLNIVADGAMIYCATNGYACLDMSGFYAGEIQGLSIYGDAGLPPSIGILLGRWKATGANGLNAFYSVKMRGTFTTTPFYNRGSETTIYVNNSFETDGTNAWCYIGDGQNHWNIQSQWRTVTQPTDTSFSSSANTFYGFRCLSTGTGNNGIWMANLKGWRFAQDSFVSTTGHTLHLYQYNTRTVDLEYHGTSDGPATVIVYVERDGSTSVDNLNLFVHDNAQTVGVFDTSAVTGVAKLKQATVRLTDLSTGPLFANTAYWEANANYSFVTEGTTPVLPTVQIGKVEVTATPTVLYGTKTAAYTTTALTNSSGTISQNNGATWVAFEGWGAGGAGGSGILCGAGVSCSGGSGGGGAGHLMRTSPMNWADLGVTSCTYTIGQSIAGGAGGVGGTTTITCGSRVWKAYGGGSGGPGVAATIAAGGGGGSSVAAGGAASGTTAGTGGSGGGGAGGSSTIGVAGASGQGSGGGATNASGTSGAGGASASGPTGGGGGGGCNAGVATTGNSSGTNDSGFAAEGNPGAAGKTSYGSSGTGGGGGNAHATSTAGVGGAGGFPGGGGGGGGAGCNNAGTPAIGGASAGGMIVVTQG